MSELEPTRTYSNHTATDVLRRLLDERGVEWGNIRNDGSESDYLTEWQFENNQGKAIAIEWAVGSGLSVEIHRYHLTPEQAIAATLGATDANPTQAESSGTCHPISCSCSNNCTNSERTGTETCRAVSMRERDKRPYLHDELVCSKCGCKLAHEFGHVWQHFCPNCGRKVVDDG